MSLTADVQLLIKLPRQKCSSDGRQCDRNCCRAVLLVLSKRYMDITMDTVQWRATAIDCTSVCLCRCPASDCSCSIAIRCNADTEDSSTVQAVTAGRAVDVRCSCGHTFCFACLAPAHEPAACHQVSTLLTNALGSRLLTHGSKAAALRSSCDAALALPA